MAIFISFPMKYFLLTTLFVSIFVGCGQSGYSIFTHNNDYYNKLSSSQKGELRYNNNTKAVVSASYLNTLYPKEYGKEEEIFLIGLYLTDSKDLKGFDNPEYKIWLNQENAYEIKAVDKNSSLVQNTSFTDRWSYYYIVKFNNQKTTNLSLTLTHKPTRTGITLTFKKELK